MCSGWFTGGGLSAAHSRCVGLLQSFACARRQNKKKMTKKSVWISAHKAGGTPVTQAYLKDYCEVFTGCECLEWSYKPNCLRHQTKLAGCWSFSPKRASCVRFLTRKMKTHSKKYLLSLLISGSATKPRMEVTAATWCAAAAATTRTQRSWWSAATASTTGAATSPAKSVSGLWRDTYANESAALVPEAAEASD